MSSSVPGRPYASGDPKGPTPWASWAIGGAVLALLAFGVVRGLSKRTLPGGADDSPGVPLLSSHVMACDLSGRLSGHLSGNGTFDAVVETRTLRDNTPVPGLTTFDGRSGKPLRSMELLGPLGDRKVACFGARALEATNTSLAGYDLSAGKRIWQTPLPERVDKFCADDNGARASFVAADKQTYRVNLVTGELSAAGKVEAPCSSPPSWGGLKQVGPGVDWWSTSAVNPFENASDRQRRRVMVLKSHEGMRVDDLWREGAAGILLAVGGKWPGSGTPMIAAVTVDGDLVWKAEVAGKNPLGVGARSFSVNLRGDRVVTSHLDEVDKESVIGSWELATGRRRWQVTIPGKLMFSRDFSDLGPKLVPYQQHCQGLAQTDQQVFVACNNTLRAYGSEDGKLLWSLQSH